MTRCAWELGLSQDEIRKRNFITTFPYQTPVALQYDVGDYHACMNQAQELADVAGFEARKSASAAKGLLRGVATAATSRPAASRRRTSPGPWARAPACSNAARCAYTPRAA